MTRSAYNTTHRNATAKPTPRRHERRQAARHEWPDVRIQRALMGTIGRPFF